MALQLIRLFPDEPRYSMTVTLSGKPFLLEFDYCQRADRWFLTVSDSLGIIQSRMKVRPNHPIMRKTVSNRKPAGVLMFLDPLGGPAPGLHELGRRVLLWYATADTSTPAPVVKSRGIILG